MWRCDMNGWSFRVYVLLPLARVVYTSRWNSKHVTHTNGEGTVDLPLPPAQKCLQGA